MSIERELLKRVRDTLLELKETHYDLYWDIQTALDHPSLDLREPFSDEEIAELSTRFYLRSRMMSAHVVRAIEKAHGIGGEE